MKAKRILSLLLVLLLILAASGCSLFGDKNKDVPEQEEHELEEEDKEYPVVIGEYLVRSRPDRIVTLSASMTEKIVDLGLEGKLVGVATSGYYPTVVSDLPRCGTALVPDLDQITALTPHVVLADSEIPRQDVEALEALGADVVVIPTATTLGQWQQSYHTLFRILEGEQTGAAWGDRFLSELESNLSSLRGRFGNYADENGRKTALYLRMMDFNVATGDTLVHELLELVGLNNVAAGYTNWVISQEQAESEETRALFAEIDVIYFNGWQTDDGVTITDLEQSSFYKGLQAVIQDRYLEIDTAVFERQGLSILMELERMASCEFAYPDAPATASFSMTAQVAPEGDEELPETWEDAWDDGEIPADLEQGAPADEPQEDD